MRLALRELWGQKRTSLVILLNLILGLTGLLTVSLFKDSVEASMALSSREHLGADLSLSARRDLTEAELSALEQVLPDSSQISRARELYTSVGAGDRARLVQLRAHEAGFPFYGSLKIEGESPDQGASLFDGEGAWVYPEVKAQVGVSEGDILHIGGVEVPVLGTVLADTVSAASQMSLAPSVYISLKTLERTDLIQRGSLVRYTYLIKIPERWNVEAVQKMVEEALPAHDIRVATHLQAAQRSNQSLFYLGDYLSLVALVALILSVLGSSYILRTYLQRRALTFGLYKALGLRGAQVQKLFFLQMALLGVAAGFLALALSVAAAFALKGALSDVLGSRFVLSFSLGGLTSLMALSLLIILLLSFPYSDRLRGLKVSQLFQESWELPWSPSWRSALLWVPAGLGLAALTLYLSGSLKVSGLFLIVLALAFSVLIVCGFLLYFLAAKWWRADWAWNQALRFLDRERYSTLAAFSSLALGVALVVMTFQLERGLVTEISAPQGEEHPGFFLFDLQEEQLADFQKFLSQQDLYTVHLAPTIRARLKTVNGETFVRGSSEGSFQTREDDRAQRMRNRGFNLTYQRELQSSQTITRGVWEEAFNEELPAISVEEQFARRLGFKLGDVLVFDVQGVDIRGQVVSFRRVNWGSLQPNFFVTFQPGVLEAAPKTYVATLPELPLEEKNSLQAELVKRFPNVSTIDVERTLHRVIEIVQSMAKSFKLMAFLALLTGLGVFLSMLQYRFFQRTKDLILFKAVGAREKTLRRLVYYEMAWLGGGATALGILVGLTLSALPSALLFDGVPLVAPSWVLWCVPLLAVGSGFLLSRVWVRRLFARSRGLEVMR